jgi:YD repeat-containing protein
LASTSPASVGPSHEAGGLRGGDQILALGDREAQHAEPEADRDADRQIVAVGLGQVREGEAEEKRDQQTYQQTCHGSDELRGRHRLDGADQPPGGDHREIGQEQEPDGDPGRYPDWNQQPGRTGLVECGLLGKHERQADESAQGSPEQTNDADHEQHALRRSG